jgi:S-adenosyl-L-methionine hydrolase (adenosine-forming)
MSALFARGRVRPITFLSDYGYADEFAGVCRGVIATIAPGAQVIDLTHGIGRAAVRQGALVLANALPYCPAGVHLAVVDPGVGTERRPVAVRVDSEDRILVGPDNGLLGLAIERLGGAVQAVDLTVSPFRLEPASATFHGRDLFAPVAARLAQGASLDQAGEPVPPDSLTPMELPEARVYPERVIAHAIHNDRFGNVILNLTRDQLDPTPFGLGDSLGVETRGGSFSAAFARTFADVAEGQVLLYEDATQTLALAVNRGSAAEALRIEPDDEVVLRPH